MPCPETVAAAAVCFSCIWSRLFLWTRVEEFVQFLESIVVPNAVISNMTLQTEKS